MKNLHRKLLSSLKKAGILYLLLLGAQISSAQYSVLYNFTGGNNGFTPYGYLTLSGGTFYGMTNAGGTGSIGNIFSIDTTGAGYTNLYTFPNGTGGASPYGSLAISGNVLYGETYSGGANSYGLIFSIHTDGTSYTDLHDFTNTDGCYPMGTLTLSGSVLYGATAYGGAHGDGVVFSINTNGTGYTDLHDFNLTDGQVPSGFLTLSGSVLYGVTCCGGANSDGNVFSISTSGSGYTDLFDFAGANGKAPHGGLDIIGSVLYGVTEFGGANDSGCVFSINTNGTGFKDMHDFTLKTGYTGSFLNMVNIGGVLYGMAENGGADGNGVVFSINTNGTGYKDIINFTGFNGSDPGSAPLGSLTLSGGNIYGMTSGGGSFDGGVIFELANVTAGVDNISEARENMKVYPNPGNGKFIITAFTQQNQATAATIEIYNELGKQVMAADLANVQSNNSIDLSSQPDGIYFYQVITKEGSLIGQGKVIVQK